MCHGEVGERGGRRSLHKGQSHEGFGAGTLLTKVGAWRQEAKVESKIRLIGVFDTMPQNWELS